MVNSLNNAIDSQLVWSRLCIEWGIIEKLSGKYNTIMVFHNLSHCQNSRFV